MSEFKLTVTAQMFIVPKPNPMHGSTLKEMRVRLDVDKNLDKSFYMVKDGVPNHAGAKATANVLLQGLISNAKYGASKGFWKEEEHMAWLFSELKRAQEHYPKATEIGEATLDEENPNTPSEN